MVGVPALLWWAGPISRIGWPTRMRDSQRISEGPTRKARKSAVSVARAGAEGDVAEDVEDADLGGERVEQVVEHSVLPARREPFHDAFHACAARALDQHPVAGSELARDAVGELVVVAAEDDPLRGQARGARALGEARGARAAQGEERVEPERTRPGDRSRGARRPPRRRARPSRRAPRGRGRGLAGRRARAAPPPSTADWRCSCRRSARCPTPSSIALEAAVRRLIAGQARGQRLERGARGLRRRRGGQRVRRASPRRARRRAPRSRPLGVTSWKAKPPDSSSRASSARTSAPAPRPKRTLAARVRPARPKAVVGRDHGGAALGQGGEQVALLERDRLARAEVLDVRAAHVGDDRRRSASRSRPAARSRRGGSCRSRPPRCGRSRGGAAA